MGCRRSDPTPFPTTLRCSAWAGHDPGEDLGPTQCLCDFIHCAVPKPAAEMHRQLPPPPTCSLLSKNLEFPACILLLWT